MKEKVIEKIRNAKEELEKTWEKVSSNNFKYPKDKIEDVRLWIAERRREAKIRADNIRAERKDIQETEGVSYYPTENSPSSRGAPKTPAVGLDKFGGEKDTVAEDQLHH